MLQFSIMRKSINSPTIELLIAAWTAVMTACTAGNHPSSTGDRTISTPGQESSRTVDEQSTPVSQNPKPQRPPWTGAQQALAFARIHCGKSALACRLAGQILLSSGHSVDDLREAVTFFGNACAQGLQEACTEQAEIEKCAESQGDPVLAGKLADELDPKSKCFQQVSPLPYLPPPSFFRKIEQGAEI